MFHTTHIHVPRNRRPSALRTFITSSSFGPADSKEPLRRGILLTAVAIVLLLIGSILTWLGFNDVFGGRMSMTGPLLIALSLLMLLLSFRQFILARKRNTNPRSSMQLDAVAEGTVTAVVVNHDDGLHPSTIIVDRYNRLSYNNPVTVHRHSLDDCAPPSYHEVTQHSSSSNTPSCATHDGQDELPPTYEESVSSGVFSSHAHHFSNPHHHHHHERGTTRGDFHVADISLRPSHGRGLQDSEDANSNRRTETIFQCARKSSPQQVRALPSLQLQTSNVPTGQNSAGRRPLPSPLQPPRHSLTPPPVHMSAPSSPRQLSAPASPYPYSAPSSPRPVSPHFHANMTPPPQYMSLLPSPHQMSAPASPHISAPPSPCMFAAVSVYNFSAPPSPHPSPHSLTPPPQYTSAPPSPRQLSAPPSPHMFANPMSPCFSGQTLVHPIPHVASAVSPSCPHPQHNQIVQSTYSVGVENWMCEGGAVKGAPPSHLQFSAPSSQPHHSSISPKPGTAQDGYTCFTYNFVTPLPVETTPTTHTIRTASHLPTAVNYGQSSSDGQNTGCRTAVQGHSPQGHCPQGQSQGHQSPHQGQGNQGQINQSPVQNLQSYGQNYQGHPMMLPLTGGAIQGAYCQQASIQRGEYGGGGGGGGGSSPQVASSPCGRTDIQANI